MTSLIFDFDGLIMDTETATFEAWREIYAEHGQPLVMETWAQCVGSDFGHFDPKRELEKLTGRTFDWDAINTERRERVMAILSTYDALPGVRERLQEADNHGINRAVASSSPRWWVEHWLKHLGLFDAFQNITCLEDTQRAKPHPSLFQHAAGKLEAAPEDVVVIEDSLNGLRAAKAADMRCVIVPCTVTRHLDFDGAWRKYESLTAFELPRSL